MPPRRRMVHSSNQLRSIMMDRLDNFRRPWNIGIRQFVDCLMPMMTWDLANSSSSLSDRAPTMELNTSPEKLKLKLNPGLGSLIETVHAILSRNFELEARSSYRLWPWTSGVAFLELLEKAGAPKPLPLTNFKTSDFRMFLKFMKVVPENEHSLSER